MKMLAHLLLIAFVLAISKADCPENWVEYEDACFHFSQIATSWLDAENHCKKYGNAYLATIDSAEKMKFIHDILIPLGHLGHHDHWIGGSDYAIEGSWRWLKTGLAIKYFNWGPDQPSGTSLAEKDCIAIRNYNGTYMWSDEDCESRHQARFYYICEEPHTASTGGPTIG